MSKITNEFRSHALRRGILVKPAKGTAPQNLAFAGSIELANLGFIVDPSELMGVSVQTITETISEARKIMGADRDMTPIYPGFPKQVQELDTMTLLVEQILHYWTRGALLPNYPTIARDGLAIEDMLRNARELRVLSASAVARELIEELVSNPVALSVADKGLLSGAIALQVPTLGNIGKIIRKSHNAENVQSFIQCLKKNGNYTSSQLMLTVLNHTNHADTILRAVLALFSKASNEKWAQNFVLATENLSDSNSRAVRMLNIPRPVRRALVASFGINTRGYLADHLVKRHNLWRKVMSAVHPYDFNLDGDQKRAMDIIHSNIEYRTLNSIVEEAMAQGDVVTAVETMMMYQPGNLLRRVVALLRLVTSDEEAKVLAKAVKTSGAKSSLTTLISAYNGILSANDTHARVTRVAGLNNSMVERKSVKLVSGKHVKKVLKGIRHAMGTILKAQDAPKNPIGIVSTVPVPLVRRDASTADKTVERGETISLTGDGDTLRIFGHWRNNQKTDGYMDIGAVVLDDQFEHLAVLTYNSWYAYRNLGTYSGDKLVHPGKEAAEFYDLDLEAVRKEYPKAIMVAMTIQSYSGWAIDKVDIIAGAMLRSSPNSGEVFDTRTVSTAFKPLTPSLQSVPLAVDLRSNKMVWIDSSSGSTVSGMSSTNDDSIGSIVYDELERERFTLGDLAKLWAKVHNISTVEKPVNQKELLNLL